MKLHWLIPGTLLTVSLLSSPADAAKLQSWRFDANLNQLEINTDGAVQPKAQLIFNPTRLVIDLPGVKFGRPQLRKPVGGAVRTVRIGQFNKETTRIVVELTPGYTLDPSKVKFTGKTPKKWMVQLPTPQLEKINSSATNDINVAARKNSRSSVKGTVINRSQIAQGTTQGKTQIQSLRVTGDGLFLRTSGGRPSVRISRSRDKKTIDLEIRGAQLSPNLKEREQQINRYGVSSVEFSQSESDPSRVKMRLKVNKNSPDWRATVSSFGGIIILPTRRVGNLPSPRIPSKTPKPIVTRNPSPRRPVRPVRPILPPNSSLATIKSVELVDDGEKLEIKGDRNLFASTTSWDRKTAMFLITIPNARLDSSVRGIGFKPNSSVLRVSLKQENANTVGVYVLPASRTQVGRLNTRGKKLSLELGKARRITPPIALPPLPRPNPISSPGRQISPPSGRTTPARRPNPRGRVVVIVDPGHGGKDPGAIGIGGLREKDVILPISQKVAEILEKNGVQAILTRKSDYFVSLKGRVQLAERANANVFVSIHANSLGRSRPDISGLEVYYYNSGYGLAQSVRKRILKTVNVRDRRVRKARFYVLRKSSMPAILVETGYVTGREDAAKLRQQWYRNKMAEGIARGILDYLKR
ncbi:N-acetylmuramoyl-L-alanine amidase [Mastigocoleus testarum]|uniref:N-acetylmuramoyl-L-alanine amidase n=1 Tax=Mastigocoleus testarum BC008 TaxID=371196 RepID=A0A0V7ZRD2_9CYAN|nr:N-acetylmuramoyl-L-alanine amidase [Mastigocoleus testarum]KST64884.1 N-acetylmuramoyl-L-alanine amidase [Mastigocoleus testarum BC008]KST67035.1 N-acetylmuramoyl-L-alanine amidase [Mastigocoleus testarum BC008]